jgi:hypothetical protein
MELTGGLKGEWRGVDRRGGEERAKVRGKREEK